MSFMAHNRSPASLRPRLSLHVLRRDHRLQLLVTHFCGTHIGFVENRPGEGSPSEIGFLHIRIAEIGLGEINSLQLSPAQISADEIGFAQLGISEKSLRQVRSQGWIETISYLHSGSITPCSFHFHASIAEIST